MLPAFATPPGFAVKRRVHPFSFDIMVDEDKRHAVLPDIVAATLKLIQRRPRYSPALKLQMIEAILDGGESVSEVTRSYDINTD